MAVGAQPAALGNRKCAAGIIAQFEGEDHPGLPDVADMHVAAQTPGVLGQQAGGIAVAADDIILPEDRQAGQCRGAAERIAGVAVRVQEAPAAIGRQEVRKHVLGGQYRRHRQEAAGQAFRQAQEIRADACLFAGEETAGSSETDRDFVGNQVDPEFVADAARLGEVGRIVHAHAACALHQRLQDQRA